MRDEYEQMDDDDIDTVLDGIYTINLSRNEALYLDDCLSLMIERELTPEGMVSHTSMRQVIPSAQLAVPIELIDKVALAVLHTTDSENVGREYPIKCVASELYLLREVSQSFIKLGQEAVGFNLKRKIYKALFKDQYEAGVKLARLLTNNSADDIKAAVRELEDTTE